MKLNGNPPRVVLISQWPNVKNGEFELIEKIRQTGYKLAVVDFLGFDVETGLCINSATLCEDYDFAISLHYFTPKFLNIPTFLWVANPLEFMHLHNDYPDVIIHHLRAYDDYLYNGSDLLKSHIRQVVGGEWQDSKQHFFAACSRQAILPPRMTWCQQDATSKKIFYCGVNWERGGSGASRAQGLLDILQEREAADFYGPKDLVGYDPWRGFKSYKGEIPFDGISMSKTMQTYGAVLAVSSPAHMKSRTSSSRVFEGLAAGVPVISDDNPHVRQLFGDLVYYFHGATAQEQAQSVLSALDQIISNPDDAAQRVRKAQELISDSYCFETCLTQASATLTERKSLVSDKHLNTGTLHSDGMTVDVFLFDHDPYAESVERHEFFNNGAYLLKAASAAINQYGAKIRIFHTSRAIGAIREINLSSYAIELIDLNQQKLIQDDWDKLRMGEKVARLVRLSSGDFSFFLTQSDYPHHDYFTKPMNWSIQVEAGRHPTLYAGGVFVHDLAKRAPQYPQEPMDIISNNVSSGLYRWSPNSYDEHELGQFCLSRAVIESLDFDRLARFDVLFPVALILEAMSKNVIVHRARHLLLRVRDGYYCRYRRAVDREVTKGFWEQHYNLLSHHSHELNALYDAFHESREIIEVVDKIVDRAPPKPILRHASEMFYSAANTTNKEWLKGVANGWATAVLNPKLFLSYARQYALIFITKYKNKGSRLEGF